jgi:hypothetical protein
MVVPDEELSGHLAKYRGTGITYEEVMALAQGAHGRVPMAKRIRLPLSLQ